MTDLGKYATVQMEILKNDILWLCREWAYAKTNSLLDEEKFNTCPSHIGTWRMNLPALSLTMWWGFLFSDGKIL